jgi:dTMP kinase
MKKGKFIVVDSGEGAGKTTQTKRAKDLYGDLVVLTREPGGSPYAAEIRKIILESQNAGKADAKTMFALFWAARADHMKNTIIPALNAGKMVICDRFDSSTFAYQIVAQGARELEKLFWQIRDFYLGDMKPDLYIYFDIDPKIGLSRKKGQGAEENNHFEDRDLTFHNALRDGFKEFLEHVPHKIIDASQPLEDVWNDFKDVLEKEIDKK